VGQSRRLKYLAFGILLLIGVLFHWKILLTHQFSLLTGSESANQAYAWYNFSVGQIKQGVLPAWDPFAYSGRSFPGEMQTGAFYPANFLLALLPFNSNGVFSPQVYHWMYVLVHVLGAWFMACLAMELGLGLFAGLISGLCFAFGGFVAHVAGWPHIFHSGIWLPAIMLFLVRALKAERNWQAFLNAALGGSCLGMSVLGGGLHVVMMQAVVIMTAIPYYYWRQSREPGLSGGSPRPVKEWATRPVLLVVMALVVGLLAGAIQLLPSMEYSGLALRWFGPGALPATERIPYVHMNGGFWPHGFLQLLLFAPFNGNLGPGAGINYYMGVFPIMLAAVGVWRYRQHTWVRYVTGLAVCAFIYSLAGMSLLHGVLYAIVPFLWMAREADRFMYLADFSIAVLAGFGIQALAAGASERAYWEPVFRVFKWVAFAAGVALLPPAIYGQPEINHMVALCLILIACWFLVFRYLIVRPAGPWARFLVVFIVLFDLYATDWSAASKIQEGAKGTDQLERLLGTKAVAKFLRSRPGAYRAQVLAEPTPNMADLYGVEVTGGGAGVTMLQDYERFWGHVDLLAMRYTVRPASSPEPGAVIYQDSAWKVYENPEAYPRAWLVHSVIVERDSKKLLERLDDPKINLKQTAFVGEPLDAKVDPLGAVSSDSLDLSRYNGNHLELDVNAGSRGLLVLSEVFYPGWKAEVNGQPARIWKTDYALRGIVVPAGRSHVALHYAPLTVRVGGWLSLATFLGVLAAFFLWRPRDTEKAAEVAAASVKGAEN